MKDPFLDFLIIEKSPEQEFMLEWDTRQLLKCEDREELAAICVNLYQQNWAKDQIIKNCLGRIGELEAQLVISQMDREQSCFMKLLRKVIPRKIVKVQSFED